MNSKLFSSLAIAVVALIAAAPLSHAKAYTPAAFNKQLIKLLGNKKNSAAINKVAGFYKQCLQDPANSKYAFAYAKYMKGTIYNTKYVAKGLQGNAGATVSKAMTQGYFLKVAGNLKNSLWNKALNKILIDIPIQFKIETTSQAIYNGIKQTALKFTTKTTVFNYYNNTIRVKNNLPPANVS